MLTKQETQSGRGAWENGRVREARRAARPHGSQCLALWGYFPACFWPTALIQVPS